jgi:hypothetical protein
MIVWSKTKPVPLISKPVENDPEAKTHAVE